MSSQRQSPPRLTSKSRFLLNGHREALRGCDNLLIICSCHTFSLKHQQPPALLLSTLQRLSRDYKVIVHLLIIVGKSLLPVYLVVVWSK